MTKRQFILILMCTIVFAFIGGLFSNSIFSGSVSTLKAENKVNNKKGNVAIIQEYLLKENLFIGLVENGKFKCLVPRLSSSISPYIRLTQIQMQEARPPDSMEIYLDQYEGKAIMVNGMDGGGWIYKASIVDKGGQLMAALVKEVFMKSF